MIKIKINTLDEAAKWRSTSFKTEWTREEIEKIDKEYDNDLLFIHYDDGIDMLSQRANVGKKSLSLLDKLSDTLNEGKEGDDSLVSQETIEDIMSLFGDQPFLDIVPPPPPPEDPDDKFFPKRKSSKATNVTDLQPQSTFNPGTKYNTPIGIYTYPWQYAKDQIFGRTLPFAQDKQFLYIYAVKDKNKILKLVDAASRGVFQKSIEIAIKKYSKKSEEVYAALINSTVTDEFADKIIKMFFNEKTTNQDEPTEENNNDLIDKIVSAIIFTGPNTDLSSEELNDLKKNLKEKLITIKLYLADEAKDLKEKLAKNPLSILSQKLKEQSTGFNEAIEKTIKKFEKKEETQSSVPSAYPFKFLNIGDNAFKFCQGDSSSSGLLFLRHSFLKLVFKPKILSGEASSNNIGLEPRDEPISLEEFERNLPDPMEYPRYWFYFVNNIFNKNQVKVTIHFQNDLGIGVLSDSTGKGVIHHLEPIQAIIFNPAFAKVVNVKLNPSSKRTDFGGVKASSQQRKDKYEVFKALGGLYEDPLYRDFKVGDKVLLREPNSFTGFEPKVKIGVIASTPDSPDHKTPNKYLIKLDVPVRVFGREIEQFPIPLEDLVKLSSEKPKEKVEESKMFIFNKDKKIFKLLK